MALNKSDTDLEQFFSRLEVQAQSRCLDVIRFAGESGNTPGIAIFRGQITEQDFQQIKVTIVRHRAIQDSDIPASRPDQDMYDSLTGMPHRETFFRRMEAERKKVEETKLPFSLLLVSIDNFHTMKKHHSKKDMDRVVSYVADIVQESTETFGVAARFDSSVFAVLLHGTNLGKAMLFAQQLRRDLRSQPLSLGQERLEITVSIGVGVCLAADLPAGDTLLSLAEQELQRAVEAGGDCICRFTPAHDPGSCQVTVEERAQLFKFLETS